MLAEATTAYRGVSVKALRSYKSVWLVVLVVALVQACYAAGFIYRTSFIVEGKRYFCLFDDAMIAMRYAANWSNGHGLVWNPGERVEGYTTLGWTFIMGLCHLLRLSPSHTCLLVQVLGVPILWGCLIGNALLARSCRLSPALACCAVVLAGTLYNLIFFTLFGMETGVLTLLVTFALADTVKYICEKRGSIRPFLWFAPAVVVRLDVLPIILFVFLFFWFSVKKGHYRLLIGLLVVMLVVSTHFLWRYQFYGQWLPNTYYLKLTGWPLLERIEAGIRQTFRTAVVFGLPSLLAAIAVIRRTKRWHFLILGSFAVGVAYQVYAGGDAWPWSRFVLPASLGLFVLAADGVGIVINFCKNWTTDAARTVLIYLITIVCVIAINGIYWDNFLLVARPQSTCDNWMNIKYVLAVKKVAEPNTIVAVTFGGVFPYFSKCKCIDLLGKCDVYIAHQSAHPQIRRAGHNKYDLTYSLEKYKPDIVLHIPYKTWFAKLYREYHPVIVEVDGSKMGFCVHNDSTKIRGGKPATWISFNDCIGTIIYENRNFQTFLGR